MFGATVAVPLYMASKMCISEQENEAKSELIGTVFVVSGISTLLQCTLGIRYASPSLFPSLLHPPFIPLSYILSILQQTKLKVAGNSSWQ